MYNTVPALKMVACTLCSIVSSFKFCRQVYLTLEKCVLFALKMQKMRVDIMEFEPTISNWSCYVKLFIYTKYVCFFSVGKCILHGKIAYSVCIDCRECVFKYGCIIRRNRSDLAMYNTLPTLKMKPWRYRSDHSMYNAVPALKMYPWRYPSDPAIYNNVPPLEKLACTRQMYFTWEKCVECIHRLQRICV